MIRRLRWSAIAPALFAVVALSCGTAGAADKSKVDHATKQVEQGAKRIGQGHVGSGFKQMFTGIGYTVFEGGKYSGETVKEFFQRTFRS